MVSLHVCNLTLDPKLGLELLHLVDHGDPKQWH